jgi:hypothetical protein
MIRMPPANSFDSMVLPASRKRAGFTRSLSDVLSSIRGSMRCRELRLASSTVGWTASAGPGAWWMMKPIQLLPASVAPTWAAFMNTIRCAEWPGESASMMSFM